MGEIDTVYYYQEFSSLSIRPSYGVRGEEILDGEGGRGRRERKAFLSFTSLPFSLPFFPFSPETPDTQAIVALVSDIIIHIRDKRWFWLNGNRSSRP